MRPKKESAMPDPRFENPKPFTDQDILDIESALGRKLPEDYCAFVKEYGGAFISGEIDGEYSIDRFDGAAAYRKGSISVSEWEEYCEIGALPFASCILGNAFVLTAGNAVHYVDYYGNSWGRGTTTHKLADSFSDFLSRIEPRTYDDEL